MRASLRIDPVKGSGVPASHIDAAQFRAAFAALASGVTVIAFDAGGTVHGLTATSFTPVSLTPPLALFCIGRDTATGKQLVRGKRAGVSILAAHQSDAARIFALPTPPDGYRGMARYAGVPVIDEAVVSLAVEVMELHAAGDHLVCICAVACAKGAARDGDPLVYHDRQYKSLRGLRDEDA